MKTKLTAAVATRVSKAMRRDFVRKAKKETGMGQSDILRALIHAYVEDRIKISYTVPTHKENQL